MGKYDELHTCHNECERPACVLRRKVATLEAELAAMKARGDRLAEALAAEQTEAMEYRVGDKVVKPRGYPFPGTVVAAFIAAGGQRFVVESELAPGMLHTFSPSQLALTANQHHGGNDADT